MAQHPFLKSIRPINLLSFGPETKEIELGSLNILIGPNGCGKSNLIEVVRLLCWLPEKEPWTVVLDTGGVDEWIWKGSNRRKSRPRISTKLSWEMPHNDRFANEPLVYEYEIGLDKFQTSFRIDSEVVRMAKRNDGYDALSTRFERVGTQGVLHLRDASREEPPIHFDLASDQSVFSQLASMALAEAAIGSRLPEILEIREFFDGFDFHQDWEFGADLPARGPVTVGQGVKRLEENATNLAQLLAYYRDYQRPIFERLNELMKKFYEPFQSLNVRLIGTHLQVAIQEQGGFSTPAYRLSDGTLRWLSLLAILLNPTPAPVTCIDEPELGLHPDIFPTLADLLIEASARTQLLVTTHSRSFLDSFTDNPDAVLVCEKVEGSTVIERLNRERLKIWLDQYSLGSLWTSGEIGGNRW